MIRGFVLRGLLAGLIAGICAGALGLVIGEGQIDRAIEVETALGGSTATAAEGGAAPSPADGAVVGRSQEPRPEGAGDSHGEAAGGEGGGVEVSRDTQHAGLVVATAIYGLAIGGLIALVFVALRGRTAHRTDARLALGLTAALFAAVVVIPFLKYPASPPGVGDPDTIGYRTELYLVLVAGSLAALLAAWRLARLVPLGQRAWRLVAGIGSFCALVGLLALALPGVDEVPAAYPTDLLTEFRVASAALQVTLWLVLAAGFAILVSRRFAR